MRSSQSLASVYESQEDEIAMNTKGTVNSKKIIEYKGLEDVIDFGDRVESNKSFHRNINSSHHIQTSEESALDSQFTVDLQV